MEATKLIELLSYTLPAIITGVVAYYFFDLHTKNELYLAQIESLKLDSKLIDVEIEKLYVENQQLQLKNKELDSIINKLTNAKTIIYNSTKLLNADSVVNEFSNYIQDKGL